MVEKLPIRLEHEQKNKADWLLNASLTVNTSFTLFTDHNHLEAISFDKDCAEWGLRYPTIAWHHVQLCWLFWCGMRPLHKRRRIKTVLWPYATLWMKNSISYPSHVFFYAGKWVTVPEITLLNLYMLNTTRMTSPSEVLRHLEVIKNEPMLPPGCADADSLPFSNF